LYDALVDEREHWLTLLTDELMPKLVEAHRPERIVLRPWVDPLIGEVEVLVGEDGPGSQLTVVAYADRPELPLEERKWARYRLGTLFGAALREWADGW
jgi:hypothetical protein